MMYRIEFLQSFYDQYSQIKLYLDRHSSTAFHDLQRRFFAVVDQLENAPKLFPSYERLTTPFDLRRAVVGKYQVFYVVDDDLALVTILNIFHGAQNIEKLLNLQDIGM